MKKNTVLFLIFYVLSSAIYAQDTTPIKHLSGSECGCGDAFGSYDEGYGVFNDKDWHLIKTKLDTFLSRKNIQESRNLGYSGDAWNILMRMRAIEWTTHKKDAIRYLNQFTKKILVGDSYLNKSNKNILHDSMGCPYTNGDPMRMPYAAYSVVMKLDANEGVKMMDATWGLLAENEPFSNNLRIGLIGLLGNEFKNADIQPFLIKLENTSRLNTEIQKIQEIKLKYALSQSKNQAEAWEKVALQNKVNLTKMSYMESMGIWEKNSESLEMIFGYGLDVSAPLSVAEKEKDSITKYWLAYMCCYIENGNYPNKSNDATTKRIDKLVQAVQNQGFNKEGKDYLDEAYQIFKKWH